MVKVRKQAGEFHRLIQELRLFGEEYRSYFRLDQSQLDHLLQMVGARITRTDTNYRESISPVERLAICLRFLVTGDSYRTIGFSFRVGRSTVAGIVPSVEQAIWDCLVGEYMPVPKEEDWRTIAAEILERWNFPNCLGSIDGKHVVIQAPLCSGLQFYNYKGTYSVVLLAVVDVIYCFRVVDVGAYGKGSDGGTLRDSAFGQALQDGTLDIPPPASLPGAEDLGPVPHVFVGDEAFPLRPNLMRPYAGHQLPLPKPVRIFNKRLSRARLVVECAFGILAARWRMYRRVLGLSPSNADACVKATCVLHNYLWRTFQEPLRIEMGMPNGHLPDVTRAGANNTPRQALQVREKLTTYFSSPTGEVPWQYAVE
ncbi:protein ALP1-like [Oncorhynchus kisutch]|uniref:protein ALP1-like n=1 Tax=Oncorhynchus kisutch TaxID=8019 RepID=UPI0012DC9BB7|nr:protein ALP1-like [Oncorhynchus kisutch]